MTAYYNEFDPSAAQWLRELIKGGHIAPGDVDERDIQDVIPNDLKGYTQCHFFAGIGVWSYALRLAGWPDDKPVWTGSCPCQPFSTAGKGKGFSDERHLWPSWHWLITQCRPSQVFGEQVASKDGFTWLDLVSSDLEGEDYACGAVSLPACGVGAPHQRQRLWFVAKSYRQRQQRVNSLLRGRGQDENRLEATGSSGPSVALGDAYFEGPQGRSVSGNGPGEQFTRPAGMVNGFWGDATFIPCLDGKSRPVEPGTFPLAHGVAGRVGLLRGYGNAIVAQAAAEFIKACS